MAIRDLLKMRCDIKRNTPNTQGRYGQAEERWLLHAENIRCHIRQVRGQMITTPQGTQVLADYTIYIMQDDDGGIREGDVIVRNGQAYKNMGQLDIGEKAWRITAIRTPNPPLSA